ncbi:MAG: TolC family protein [Duncaniella sp.]|uniref:TolC family protein n=1 Tax=Duncaniella sp. TaxID=2518496 RepID=UPI0023CBDA25|nr:TolC family protein [Duncaniella sp.]MDE6090939.1 TolC family protein [Duncaniella sp.]
MFRKITILFLSLVPGAMFASDFDDVLNTVLSNNLSLKYTEAENSASIAELKAENTLEAPEVSFESLWGGTEEAGDKRNFSISQSFDWPGVYAARRDAIKKTSAAMQYLREASMIETRTEIRVALIDIINVRQRIATTEKICEGFRTMVEYFAKAVETGQETRLDYNKAVIERINSERELKSLKSEESILLATLQALNGGKPVDDIVNRLGDRYPRADVSTLRPDRETLRMKDPAIAASRASLEAQKSLVKAEKRALLPGFSVGYLHEWEAGETFNGFSVSVTLPFLTQRRKAKAAAIRLEAQDLEQEMSLIKLASELQGEYETALGYQELLREYRGVMDDDSNFELLKKALDAGQINFLTYMQELNYFLAARRDFLDIHYRYHLALARLQRYE